MCNCHKWTKSQLLVHHPTLTSRMKSCFFSVAILVLINPIPLILRKPQMVPNICKSLTEPWFIARKKSFFWHRSSWDNRWPSCNSCSNFSDLTYLGATFEGCSNLADCLKKWRITRIYHHSLGFTNLYNHFLRIYQDLPSRAGGFAIICIFFWQLLEHDEASSLVSSIFRRTHSHKDG